MTALLNNMPGIVAGDYELALLVSHLSITWCSSYGRRFLYQGYFVPWFSSWSLLILDTRVWNNCNPLLSSENFELEQQLCGWFISCTKFISMELRMMKRNNKQRKIEAQKGHVMVASFTCWFLHGLIMFFSSDIDTEIVHSFHTNTC